MSAESSDITYELSHQAITLMAAMSRAAEAMERCVELTAAGGKLEKRDIVAFNTIIEGFVVPDLERFSEMISRQYDVMRHDLGMPPREDA